MSQGKPGQGNPPPVDQSDATHFDIEDMRRYLLARGQSEKEGTRARAWRENMGLSRRELAELTGYGERTIAAFESGEFGPGKPIDERTMLTYRLACASVAFGIDFNWSDATLELRGTKLTVPIDGSKQLDPLSEAADLAIKLNKVVHSSRDNELCSLSDALLITIGKKLAYKFQD